MSFFGKKQVAIQNNQTDTLDTKSVKIKREEGLNFKCEQFFGKNWKYIFFFIGICFLVFGYELNNISAKMASLEKIVYDNNDKVVLTTTDGRAIRVTKEPLRAEYLKQYAISVFSNNLLVSRSQLTNNFQLNSFKNYGDIIKNSKNLEFMFKEFFDNENKIAIGDFTAYLQWLLSSIAQDKLPEFISLRDYTLDKYEYNENTFKLELSLKVTANSYILARGKYETQNGIFKVYVEGSYNLAKSTDSNPYGMKVDRLKISPVVKGGAV